MMHVIYTDLSILPPDAYTALYKNATDDRKMRADRYLRREDALRCLVAGALLKYALGSRHYTVETAAHGKPHISEKPGFHFNLSHSGRWAVIAWGDSEVGVDVEEIPRDEAKSALARRYFTREEQDFVFQSPEGTAGRFAEIWTKKESYLKFLGTGLRKSLNSFCVLSPELARNFHTHTLEGGYCLSLYTTEKDCRLELLDATRLV